MYQELLKNYTIFREEATSALAGFYAGPANADICGNMLIPLFVCSLVLFFECPKGFFIYI